jgi:transcriptional regulator with XRE-family HTH domain
MEVKALEGRERRLPPPALGPMLQQARARSGLGQRQASRLAGLSQGYLCHLEQGARTPSRAVAEVLADVLGLTPGERQQLYGVAVTDAGRYCRRRLQRAA